jgi:hypothetical protein
MLDWNYPLAVNSSAGIQVLTHSGPYHSKLWNLIFSILRFAHLGILCIRVAAHGQLLGDFWTECIEYQAILVPEYIQINQEFETSSIHFSDFPFLDVCLSLYLHTVSYLSMQNGLIFLIGICLRLNTWLHLGLGCWKLCIISDFRCLFINPKSL